MLDLLRHVRMPRDVQSLSLDLSRLIIYAFVNVQSHHAFHFHIRKVRQPRHNTIAIICKVSEEQQQAEVCGYHLYYAYVYVCYL